eukprot:CAMPEP_0169119632 /NCGR_PEP_ID=MMETSP1015-20121227/31667_1 /TAXON_ID=342587 /ORGANISM="Karlodinium micrum, Strain CCMP2283" /LENGTH=697 /DNA_ID=CAMNT_0009182539 /DNA_START=135 /DNA_END=2225 /DNA_ORIENTATION=-
MAAATVLMTAIDADPPASQEFNAEPLKIEVSCLSSAFSFTADAACEKTQQVTSIGKTKRRNAKQQAASKEAVKVKVLGGDEESFLAEQQTLVDEHEELLKRAAEQHLLQEQICGQHMPHDQFPGADMWLQGADWWSCMPPEAWAEVETWPQCWPEGWQESWQGYPMFPAWQDTFQPVEAPLIPPGEFHAKVATVSEQDYVERSVEEIAAESTSIEENSAESTEEGCTISGCTSEDDCSSPGYSVAIKDCVSCDELNELAAGRAPPGLVLPAIVKTLEEDEAAFKKDDLSIDDLLLIKLEERESKESGADEKNSETFGQDASEGWSVAAMFSAHGQRRQSNASIDPPMRLLPPAPTELPPTPPAPELECDLVFPPGLPMPESDTVDSSSTSPCSSIELPPGLFPHGRQESNSGSDADESDTEPLRSFSTSKNPVCWSSWLVDSSDEMPHATVNVEECACPSFLLDDTQKSSDEELPVTHTGVFSGVAPAHVFPEVALPQRAAVDSIAQKSHNHRGSDASSTVARSSLKKLSKPRNKPNVEPRRSRNKHQAIASEKVEAAPSSAIVSITDDVEDVAATPSNRSWLWILVMGLIIVAIAVLANYQEQLFSSGSLQTRMTKPLIAGESDAWTAQSPQDAPAHYRNRPITSILKNMDIEFARAEAVTADIRSKMNNAKEMRKAKKQQEQIMRQRDGDVKLHW